MSFFSRRIDLKLLWMSIPFTRIAVVLGVLAIVFIFSATLVRSDSRTIMLLNRLSVGIVGLFILSLNLNIAPLAILFVAVFVPFSLPTGTGSPIVASLLITMVYTGMWILRMISVEKRIYLERFPVNMPLLAFMGIVIVSLVWSMIFRDSTLRISRSFPLVQTASAAVMVLLPGAFLITGNLVRNVKTLKWMVGLILFAGTLYAVKQVTGIPIPVNSNGMFTMWVVSLSGGLIFFAKTIKRWQKYLLAALVGVLVYWGFGINISWIAGWLPGFVALGFLVWTRSKKLALLFIPIFIFMIWSNKGYFSEALVSESGTSGFTRLAAWMINWQVTGQHLLFGTGPGGYAAYYMTYFPTQAMATHSNYIDILAQTGLVGFGFYLAFFGILTWYGFRLCARLRGRGDFLEALAWSALAGVLGCIVIMAFGDWLIPFAYTQTIAGYNYAVYNWLFMGTLLAVDRLTKTQVQKTYV